MKDYAAHINDNGKIQTIKSHLEGTAALAGGFADTFNSGEYAYICGLLHDIGKYSDQFQKRIRGACIRVDHSTAGAQEINKLFPKIGLLPAYCIAGHHTGLADGGTDISTHEDPTLLGRLKKKVDDYVRYKDDISLPKEQCSCLPIRPLTDYGFSVSFYIRMLFSCLVDADYLDTEAFMSGGKADRMLGANIETLAEKLRKAIDKELALKDKTSINIKRTEILNRCMQKSSAGSKGLYTLTVPTGGGKTISSLSFALRHAEANEMKRIIYVIPYNSIIEQNAAVFSRLLGEENVLEHHSDVSYDSQKDDEDIMTLKKKLATENWDMPLVVTTSVQFFESLFSNKSSKCRKLHNICNSVIIFDEAQMLPIEYLKPCVRAIAELVHNYGCSAVLCTATQPALGSYFPKEMQSEEICENVGELYEFFKRVEIGHAGELNDEPLAARLNAEKQVLCIVNTRRQAQCLFEKLRGEGCFHLSTLMYSLHRKRALQEIRKRLDENLPCRVVSTSLIEAGVDVDFPVVYRAEAGLDSILQAAGRCNREGKSFPGHVYVFHPALEYRRNLPDMMKRPIETMRTVISQYENIGSPEAIRAYFSLLYMTEGGNLDRKNILAAFDKGKKKSNFPFAQVAGDFKLIENPTHSIIIPDGEDAKALAVRMKAGERTRPLLRQVQKYVVNVFDRDYEALNSIGAIDVLDEQFSVLKNMELYSEQMGLNIPAGSGIGIFVGYSK